MGGAYTAMDQDASAMAWYNPATLAFLRGQSFSAAVGIYKKFDTVYGFSEDITKASMRVNQGFFRALPSSTGSIVRSKDFLPDYTIALSIVTPEYENYKGDIASTPTNSSSLTVVDESLWVGSGISKKISERESVGLSIYYTARSYQQSVSDRTFSTTSKQIYTEEREFTQNGIVPILGYFYRWGPRLRFGASVRFSSIHIAGRGSYFDSTIDSTSSAASTDRSFSALDSKTRIPSRISFGISGRPLDELWLSADLSYYGKEQYEDVLESTVSSKVEHLNVLNGSLGGELALRPWLKARLGVFTNFSSHPDPDASKVHATGDRVDQLGFSANLALRSGGIQYTFGGYYTGGRGRSVQRINQQYEVVPKAIQVFTMLVGTSYSF